MIKYEVTFLNIVRRPKFGIFSTTLKTAWGRHNTGAWHTACRLKLSATLPSSPAGLDRMAVHSTEHQMKWLACSQEPGFNKKCTFSFNTEAALNEVRCFLRRTWSCQAYTSHFPNCSFSSCQGKEMIPPHPAYPKSIYEDNCRGVS